MGKIALKGVSFLIPVRIDHPDRLYNLDIVTDYLLRYFETSIWIWECDAVPKVPVSIRKREGIHYYFEESNEGLFRRTKINNQLIKSCPAPIGVLYDTDVIIPPARLLESVNQLRRGAVHFALPYDGSFVQVDRYHGRIFARSMDAAFLIDSLPLFMVDTYLSVGGCFVFDKGVYHRCGLENEAIEGWGHDDAERVKRLNKLGMKIYRPDGALFHLWHERGNNSWFYDQERATKSYQTYFELCKSDKIALEKQISQWEWGKDIPSTACHVRSIGN